jgi:hypothetical protein
MAGEQAKQALLDVREAIAAVNEGRVEKNGTLLFEGVRAYSATTKEVRRLTPQPAQAKKRAVSTG